MYQYTPLQHPDWIRLLILHPGEFESPIQIDLGQVEGVDDLQYEALSYTWATEDGDSRQSSQITCQNGKTLLVTKNCELALRYLRKTDLSRFLWVDAICINQEDNRERGHQVERMRDIYANATEVLIWLGESSRELVGPVRPNCVPLEEKCDRSESSSVVSQVDSSDMPSAAVSVSDVFLESLSRMMAEVRQMQRKGQNPTLSSLYRDSESQLYEGMTKGKMTSYCVGFWDIVHRRWWSRVWVVQEVVVARSATLLCSKKCTPFQDFFDWHRLLEQDDSPKSQIISRYFGIADYHLMTQSYVWRDPINLIELVLFAVRQLHASDPRDKIFGILGLSARFGSLLPSPDYDASTTSIFTNVAKTILLDSKSLAILCDATALAPALGHPSWAPDWSQPSIMNYYGWGLFKAARMSESIFTLSQDDRQLHLKGRICDEIGEVQFADSTAYCLRGPSVDRIPGFLKSLEVASSLSTYPTGEPVDEALWQALCWDMKNNGQSRSVSSRTDEFREWLRILTSKTDLEIFFGAMPREDNTFLYDINSTTPLCVTAKGFLAAVPYTTEAGDRIAIFSGGDVPFVLRPNEDSTYRLVGACYVHGIMDGEAFPDDPEELEWLSIR